MTTRGESMAFPMAEKKRKGYDTAQVDKFFQLAKESYASASGKLKANTVQNMAFELRRKGYSTEKVDRALDRLEDVLRAAEIRAEIAELGHQQFLLKQGEATREIIARCSRPEKKRFRRMPFFAKGYQVKAVDTFLNRIRFGFETKKDLTITDLRLATFRTQRGGYREEEVDSLINATIRVFSSFE